MLILFLIATFVLFVVAVVLVTDRGNTRNLILGLLSLLCAYLLLIGMVGYSDQQYNQAVYDFAEGGTVIETLSATTDIRTDATEYKTEIRRLDQ